MDNVITFKYKNWKGNTSVRTVDIIEYKWTISEWHSKEVDYYLIGFDLDKGATRTYLVKDIILEEE